MLSLYPVYIFFTKLLNIHDNIFIWLIYCPIPPLNCKLHEVKNRIYISSSLNLLYLAQSQYGIYILSTVCQENSKSPTNVTSFSLLLHVLLHQHSSISARKEGRGEIGRQLGSSMSKLFLELPCLTFPDWWRYTNIYSSRFKDSIFLIMPSHQENKNVVFCEPILISDSRTASLTTGFPPRSLHHICIFVLNVLPFPNLSTSLFH